MLLRGIKFPPRFSQPASLGVPVFLCPASNTLASAPVRVFSALSNRKLLPHTLPPRRPHPRSPRPYSAGKSKQPIRSAARALIIHDGYLLTVVLRDSKGDLHVLPGGGQMHGETLANTVRRECREELGVEISVQTLAYVREYIGANHDFAKRHRDFHQVEAVFLCTIQNPGQLGAGCEQDNRQVGLKWIPLREFSHYRFSPSILQTYVQDGQLVIPQPYLGDNH